MVNPKAVLQHLDELRAFTANEEGAQRIAWSPMWLKAREWYEEKLSALSKSVAPNLEHHYDAAGNHWVTLPGSTERSLVIGSHLDSVPNGGWLDGCLGVLSGLEILTSLAKQYDGKPLVTIKLVDWADEEGARFGRSLFGSSAFAGTHTIEADRVRTDRDGLTLDAALKNCGYDIDAIGNAICEQKDIAAYLELHIEQGPILEKLDLPLGVVQGTKGVERWAITFRGQEAHSGSTPMEVRRDALAACAKLALEIRSIARKDPKLNSQSVATMGSVKTFPGIVTAIVGRCEATLDMRDLNADVLAQMLADARTASERFAVEECCTVEWSKIWSIAPILFHPTLIELCDETIKNTVGTSHQLPSGPLHDAAEVAQIGIPTVMMFVQSINGLSHNKFEDTDRIHIEQAVVAMNSLAERTMVWIQSH